ncbi:hypothetical protein [Chromatium okenii]|jgi:hypothetical protein|uniref:Uncharacterized protein n=1 Tax=Chromatium okenii TaxID=61644 RepID=A0A2S7XMU0_9GAMM|nr:hypothetical protein [Chromatium okenii]MBV5309577.1 hypothetical protein [Chromatium okenii]MBV5311384.1 hypothetical protein [Chromatium okenii]PQJ94758.1 hypothetical protein CXB77_18475 [Chromatium okenii]
MNQDKLSAAFLNASNEYSELVAQGLGESPAAARAFARMMENAPQSFMDVAHDVAMEMGLMPEKPDAYTANGEPVYLLESIATRLGISKEEAEKSLHEFEDATGKQFLNTGDVHSVQ